ncbi:uncharacterized protein LOC128888101 isoform X1 [Hylaeus anthracinus]|uniref:uncharacterized protein LOC128888101 isoform X1 n=1 Tax=Hylaeus anthracinus TaxID=313031 RepID=UPI0023B8AAAC|nr:uncharacterized protein LOC128888101 isoform X1 [Hylaeus anthracinus]
MDANNVDDEDEDIVIQGSALYEHLHNLGYTDFTSVAVLKSTTKNKGRSFRFIDFIHSAKSIFKKLFVVYLRIIQDDTVSKKQVGTILNAKVLLNDHACIIHGCLDKYNCKSWRTMLLKFILLGAVLTSPVYIPFGTRYKSSTNLFILFTLLYVGYIEYTRVYAHRDLKTVVSLQNDLFDLYKKGLKILRYGYKIKLNKRKCSQEFNDLTAGRLKYLQPITENLVKCLEHASRTYYHVSLILTKILPINVFHEDLLTRFEIESFEIRGEINYQKLKNLYHTYILTQSEMLHLLAIAYDNHTWEKSCNKIPELKLAYIIHFLIKYLTVYKNKLSKVIDAYYSFKVEPTLYKYRGSASSQWQDLYMHLYLGSNKLQVAYGHILSIIRDIDDNIYENIPHEDYVENTMLRLNEAMKDIETAKSFVEFSSLFLVKTRNENRTDNYSEMNMLAPVANSDMPVVHDSEPEILDEVFEEYIKDEYLKPLSEECDEILLYNHKRDKSLFKNFMIELKDALVDKQKSMSIRELKALERMQKNVINETNSDDYRYRIPTPPPMPSFDNALSIEQQDDTIKMQSNKSPQESKIVKPILESREDSNENDLHGSLAEKTSPILAIPLPISNEFSLIFPPPFLKASEETFTGSGENSEDEVIETNNEN